MMKSEKFCQSGGYVVTVVTVNNNDYNVTTCNHLCNHLCNHFLFLFFNNVTTVTTFIYIKECKKENIGGMKKGIYRRSWLRWLHVVTLLKYKAVTTVTTINFKKAV